MRKKKKKKKKNDGAGDWLVEERMLKTTGRFREELFPPVEGQNRSLSLWPIELEGWNKMGKGGQRATLRDVLRGKQKQGVQVQMT